LPAAIAYIYTCVHIHTLKRCIL